METEEQAQTEPSSSKPSKKVSLTDDELTEHLANVGVPRLYQGARLKDCIFEMPPINDSGLFLTGPTGTGKTYLAAATLADRLPGLLRSKEYARWDAYRSEHVPFDKYFYNAAFVCVPALLLSLRGTFSTQERILNGLIEHQLLVLDDLGPKNLSEWALQSLYTLLSGRINEVRPTIVTSNLTLREIDNDEPRLASRLGGMAYTKMEGDDRRIEARKKDRRAEGH